MSHISTQNSDFLNQPDSSFSKGQLNDKDDANIFKEYQLTLNF